MPLRKNITLGITLGDPASIGPEIIRKTLFYFSKRRDAPRFLLIGSARDIPVGKPTKRSARRAWDALETSVELLREKKIDAVVNGPVCKANLHDVGFPFPGQTEFYAARACIAPGDVTMMLASAPLTVSLVTTHCSLQDAIRNLSARAIVAAGQRTLQALRCMKIKKPKLAVCGLNPHAGENGLFGDEEQKMIAPAIRRLQKIKHAVVSGPHPPDTVFLRAARGDFHAVLCMVHDQGLIPLKLIGFDTGVNLTLGLPFWRASPDHGTAFDIAGKNRASPSSLIHAIRLVQKLCRSSPFK